MASTVTAEVRIWSLGWHPDPLPYSTLGSLPGLCALAAPSVTREGWWEGQAQGVIWTDRHCCGHLLWRPAVQLCSVSTRRCRLHVASHPPIRSHSPRRFCRGEWGGGVSLSARYMLGCQITLALSWDLEQCVNWWHWERKFIWGAAMKCSENCFHVLMSGEASLLLKPCFVNPEW